jgi:SAM-dependent methyltransferase
MLETVRSLDPLVFVQEQLAGTHGNLYRRVRRLPRLPIPRWPGSLEPRAVLADVGGHWVRWAIAAAQAGGVGVVIDLNLEAAVMGSRITRALGLPVHYMVGDGCALPLGNRQMDVAFSYSVLQHFSKEDARRMVADIARITKPGGMLIVQLPNRFGLRQTMKRFQQAISRDTNPFRIRYWMPDEMKKLLAASCRDVNLRIDGFFTLNPRPEDADLLPAPERAILKSSSVLTRLAAAPFGSLLSTVADSLWVSGKVMRTDEMADQS